MSDPSKNSSGRNGSKDAAKGDDALLLAAAEMVPFYKGRLDVAHNAASHLKALGDAKKSLIAYARYKIRTEHVELTWRKGASYIVGDKNTTRAEEEFLKRLKFVQGDADEFTVRNMLHVFEVVVSIYRGRKEWLAEGFTDVDLRVLKSILGDLKIPA